MKVDVSKLQFTAHAMKRATERMDLPVSNPVKVRKHIRELIANATYIGRTMSTTETECEMFANDSYGFHLSTDLKKVVTIIKFEKMPHNPVLEKVKMVVHREFKKIEKAEITQTRKLELHMHEAAVEIANLRLRKYKSRSEAVRMSCDARINALELSIKEARDEIVLIKSHKRQVARALASVI